MLSCTGEQCQLDLDHLQEDVPKLVVKNTFIDVEGPGPVPDCLRAQTAPGPSVAILEMEEAMLSGTGEQCQLDLDHLEAHVPKLVVKNTFINVEEPGPAPDCLRAQTAPGPSVAILEM